MPSDQNHCRPAAASIVGICCSALDLPLLFRAHIGHSAALALFSKADITSARAFTKTVAAAVPAVYQCRRSSLPAAIGKIQKICAVRIIGWGAVIPGERERNHAKDLV